MTSQRSKNRKKRKNGTSHAKRVEAYLTRPDLPEEAFGYHEFQGFLFAVASAPDVVMPSEWLPIVWGGQPEFETIDEAEAVTGSLMALYNDLNTAILEGRIDLPRDCRFRDDPLANLEHDAPMKAWSWGFIQGHSWLEDSWDVELPDELGEQLGTSLMVLSFFADRLLAEQYRKETSEETTLDELAVLFRGGFVEAMASYAHLGRSIDLAIREAESDGE